MQITTTPIRNITILPTKQQSAEDESKLVSHFHPYSDSPEDPVEGQNENDQHKSNSKQKGSNRKGIESFNSRIMAVNLHQPVKDPDFIDSTQRHLSISSDKQPSSFHIPSDSHPLRLSQPF